MESPKFLRKAKKTAALATVATLAGLSTSDHSLEPKGFAGQDSMHSAAPAPTPKPDAKPGTKADSTLGAEHFLAAHKKKLDETKAQAPKPPHFDEVKVPFAPLSDTSASAEDSDSAAQAPWETAMQTVSDSTTKASEAIPFVSTAPSASVLPSDSAKESSEPASRKVAASAVLDTPIAATVPSESQANPSIGNLIPRKEKDSLARISENGPRSLPTHPGRPIVRTPSTIHKAAKKAERYKGPKRDLFVDPIIVAMRDKHEINKSDKLFNKVTRGINQYSGEGRFVQKFMAKEFLDMSPNDLARYPRFTHLPGLQNRMRRLALRDRNGGPGDLTVEQYIRRLEAEDANHDQILKPGSAMRPGVEHEHDQAKLRSEIDSLYMSTEKEAPDTESRSYAYSYKPTEKKDASYVYSVPLERPIDMAVKSAESAGPEKNTSRGGGIRAFFSKFFGR